MTSPAPAPKVTPFPVAPQDPIGFVPLTAPLTLSSSTTEQVSQQGRQVILTVPQGYELVRIPEENDRTLMAELHKLKVRYEAQKQELDRRKNEFSSEKAKIIVIESDIKNGKSEKEKEKLRKDLEVANEKLAKSEKELADKVLKLKETQEKLTEKENEIASQKKEIDEKDEKLEIQKKSLSEKEEQIAKSAQEILGLRKNEEAFLKLVDQYVTALIEKAKSEEPSEELLGTGLLNMATIPLAFSFPPIGIPAYIITAITGIYLDEKEKPDRRCNYYVAENIKPYLIKDKENFISDPTGTIKKWRDILVEEWKKNSSK